MTTVVNGLLGGLASGIVAALVFRVVADDPSQTAAVLAEILGAETPVTRWMGGLQVLYGGLAGGVFVAAELFVLGVLGVPPTTGEAFGAAVAWSALLFGLLNFGWRVAAAGSFTPTHLTELLVYHLVYGLAFGLWIRVTWIT